MRQWAIRFLLLHLVSMMYGVCWWRSMIALAQPASEPLAREGSFSGASYSILTLGTGSANHKPADQNTRTNK
jgi:hypothetical protein